MNRRRIMSNGYKSTIAGIIPDDWRAAKLGEIAEVQTGIQKGAKKKGATVSMPYIRVANVQDGFLELSEVKQIQVPIEDVDRYRLKRGDVLMTEGGDFDKLGRGTIWNNEIEHCVHQNHVFVVRTNSKVLHPYILNSFSSSASGRKYFLLCSKQSTNLASVNSSQLKAFPIPIAPLAEQQRIVEILGIWDDAIEKTRKLIDKLKDRNRGLVQQLLTGKRRLKGFQGKWKNVTLNEVAKRVVRRNDELNDTVVTISAQRGFVRQEDFFNKRVASETILNYYLLHKGEFAYNRSYSNGYVMGAFKRLDDFPKAVVTTLYICFGLKSNIDSNFMIHFFEGGQLNQGLSKIAKEGGRAHGLLNISLSDFFELEMCIPEFREQKAIAHVLDQAQKELRIYERRLTTTLQQKKGLMQKLLTGEIRVGINANI